MLIGPRAGRRRARVFDVAACVGLALILELPISASALAQNTKTAVNIPRDHRFITQTRVPVHDGDTWFSILTGLDFARTGAPPSRIDPAQVTEIVAMTSAEALQPGDCLFVVAISKSGDSRQVVSMLNLYNPKRRFEIRLEDDGAYSKESGARP
jgi:hypothetical protein